MEETKHLLEMLNHYAAHDPDKTIYRFLNEQGYTDLTYQNLALQSKAIAALLQSRGDVRTERVMLLLAPGLSYITAFFGCLYAGAIPVPAYPPRRNHHSKRLAAIMHNAQARFVLTQNIFLDTCPSASHKLAIEDLDVSLAAQFQPVDIDPRKPAFLQYTSGSTGTPKGIVISHTNIMANLKCIAQHIGVASVCNWLPPFHDMGLIGTILYPLYTNAISILMSPTYFLAYPWKWLESISQEKVIGASAPNFGYDYCVRKIPDEKLASLDLSSWKFALNGSEPVSYQTMQRFYERFSAVGFSANTFYPVYGLAEATLFVSASPTKFWSKPLCVSASAFRQHNIMFEQGASKTLVSCGMASSQHEIKIVDPETKSLLSENTVGEIWVNGPSVAQGYWDNPEQTECVFKAQIANEPGKLYLRTGDLGFINQRNLYVTGRIKDLIVIRGCKYYPKDLENTIKEINPIFQLHETVALSILEQNEEHLIILQEIGRKSTQYIEKFQKIHEAVMLEHGIHVKNILLIKLHTLPKTSSGKIQRQACKEAFLTDTLSVIAQWKNEASNTSCHEENEIYLWTSKWLSKRLPFFNGKINLNASFSEIGLDSLGVAEFVTAFQEYYGKQIDISVISPQSSLSEIIALLEPQKNNNAMINTTDPAHAVIKTHYFDMTDGISADTIMLDGRRYINYSGYNYLGMSGDPFVINSAVEAIKQYGTSVSASRIASGQKEIHIQLEKAIASLIGADDCLVFSAGHATNIAVITHLFGPNDLILYDSLCHNSILQGVIFSGATRIAFAHNDCDSLEQELKQHQGRHQKMLIVSEGIFSMDGDIPNVPQLVSLKKQYNAFLMLDEAHSIGTLGQTGGGIREYFDLNSKDVDIWMGTLSKSFASCGGYIAGSAELIEHLRYHAAAFVYSAGISPANTAAALAAICLMKQQPERLSALHQHHHLLWSLLKEANIPIGSGRDTPIIPIILGETEKTLAFSQQLKDAGIYATPIVYPAVEQGKARVRLFINCLHNEMQLEYTANTILRVHHKFIKCPIISLSSV